MEVTINIDGQALSVEVTVEVYEYLDRAAFALCTEAQRRRLLLYALEGLSYAEIAGLCHCSKAAIQDSIEAVCAGSLFW